MPTLAIQTNLAADQIPVKFLAETVRIISEILQRPIEYCTVSVTTDVLMMRGLDDQSPCAMATLLSIGLFGVEENKKYSEILCKHVTENLGIPEDRFLIQFCDVLGSAIGHKGITYDSSGQ